MHSTSHLWSDLLWIVLVPPMSAFLWLLLSRGWTASFGTSDDDAVKGWTQSGFWIVLSVSYVIAIGMLLYAYLVQGR